MCWQSTGSRATWSHFSSQHLSPLDPESTEGVLTSENMSPGLNNQAPRLYNFFMFNSLDTLKNLRYFSNIDFDEVLPK